MIFFGPTFRQLRHKMDQDRRQADLSTPELDGEAAAVSRQPKKRFIGRRAAAEKAAAKGEANGGIEDSGAIQGPPLTILLFERPTDTLSQSLHLEGALVP